jgi:hypothetical protein
MTQIDTFLDNFFNYNTYSKNIVLLSWQQQNKKQQTTNHFLNYILNSKEFNIYYEKTCIEICNIVFDYDTNIDFKEMITKYETFLFKKQAFLKDDFESFVKNEKEFDNFYITVIKSVFQFIYSNEISFEQINSALEMVRQVNFIKIVDSKELNKRINEIITNTLQLPVVNDDINNDVSIFNIQNEKIYFLQKYETLFERKPSIMTICNFETFLKKENSFIDIYLNNLDNNYDKEFNEIIEEFNEIFKREMTVFEYKKMYDIFKTDSRNRIIEYKNNYDINFKLCNNVYNQYLDDTINDVMFSKKFLKYLDLDEDTFVKLIIDYVIDMNSYKEVMNKKIKDLYKSNFEKNINSKDNIYFFNMILKNKMNLKDDNLPKFINELKIQTDSNLDEIKDIHNSILQRCPDEEEYTFYIDYYRINTIKLPNIVISDELYEGLEYNDVLMKFINTNLKNNSQSNVYKKLKEILSFSDTSIKKDFNKVKNHLD